MTYSLTTPLLNERGMRLVGHAAIDHRLRLALEGPDRQPQIAAGRLVALGIGRRIGRQLKIDRVAAEIHQLAVGGSVDPGRFDRDFPGQIQILIVPGGRGPHAGVVLLLKLEDRGAGEILVEVAGELAASAF